jgi:hypothetical protein
MTDPGSVDLAATLATLDPRTLDDHDALEMVRAWERVASWVAAKQLDALAEFVRRPDVPASVEVCTEAARAADAPIGRVAREFPDCEVAAALRISRRSASARISLATSLASHLPGTRAALATGRIDLARARAISDGTAALAPDAAAAVEQRVLDRAERQATSGLRSSVARATLAVDPVAAQQRCARACRERRFWLTPLPDGMAEVRALLPAEDAVSVAEAVGAAARALKARAGGTEGESRTTEQLLADAFAAPFLRALDTGTLDGALPVRLGRRHGRRARIQVTVAASTLLGLDEQPAELGRYGPLDAATARRIAADPSCSTWQRVLTDPISGTVLDVGREVYRPPAPLAHHVILRDGTCRAPGCSQPAVACDLDHCVPFPDGPTSADNLHAYCRRHHRLKQHPAVRVQAEVDGSVQWTFPTGHVYDVHPGVIDPRDGWAGPWLESAPPPDRAPDQPPDRQPDRPPEPP